MQCISSCIKAQIQTTTDINFDVSKVIPVFHRFQRTSSLEPGSPPTLYRIKNKKGESLEDFDHVLDMVGHGWAWSRILSAKTEVLTDLCPP